MKNVKFLIIFCFSLSLFNSNAQDFPFPQDSASWKYLARPWDSGSFAIPYYNTYLLFGDTLIGGKQYQFLFHYNENCGYFLDNLSYIRTENNRVYFLEDETAEEKVLYDFNLEIGDYFYIDLPCGYQTFDSLQVILIDSVMISGTYRKQWHFGEYGIATWIEGIGIAGGFGTMLSPFYSDDILLDGAYHSLLCFMDNGEELISETFIYNNNDYWNPISLTFTCNGTINSISELETEKEIKISPNPFSTVFNIEYEGFADIDQIELISLTGRTLKNLPLEQSINLAGVEPGIYLLKIKIKGKYYYKRIVKVE